MKRFLILLTMASSLHAQDLFTAARTNDVAQATSLLAAGADVNAKDAKGYTPLIMATYDGSYNVAKLLIAHHASLEARDNSGRTALMGVAFKGDEKEVKLLLDSGADVNAKDSKGMTSTMYAVMFGHLEIAKTLHEAAK